MCETKSVQVAIIRKSITTAPTFQPLLIIRIPNSLAIHNKIFHIWLLVWCQRVCWQKTYKMFGSAELLGKVSDIWRIKKVFWRFPKKLLRSAPTPENLPFPPLPVFPRFVKNNFGANSSTQRPSFHWRNQIAAEKKNYVFLFTELAATCLYNESQNESKAGKPGN